MPIACRLVSNLVFGNSRWRHVRLNQPDSTVSVIAGQFKIIGNIHLSRPYNFGSVDFRGVVHPLIEGIVLR
jgi:hypothetical protein